MSKVVVRGVFEDLSPDNRAVLDEKIRLAAIRNSVLEVRLHGSADLSLPQRIRMVSDYIESHYLRQYFGPVCVLTDDGTDDEGRDVTSDTREAQ